MSSHHDSESRITQAGFLKQEHLFIFSKEELAMDPGNHCSTHVHALFFSQWLGHLTSIMRVPAKSWRTTEACLPTFIYISNIQLFFLQEYPRDLGPFQFWGCNKSPL